MCLSDARARGQWLSCEVPNLVFPLRDDGVGPHVAVAGSIPASAIPKKGVSLLSKNASYKR